MTKRVKMTRARKYNDAPSGKSRYFLGRKKTQNRPASFCAGCFAKLSAAVCRCGDLGTAALRMMHQPMAVPR